MIATTTRPGGGRLLLPEALVISIVNKELIMLIPDVGWAALLEAGIEVHPLGPREVELRGVSGGRRWVVSMVVQRISFPLTPARLIEIGRRAEPARLLLVAPTASAAVLADARSAGISVMVVGQASDERVRGHLASPRGVIELGSTAAAATSDASGLRTGPRPWGALTVASRLWDGRSWTQTDLAAVAGVTQGRVSQTLKTLRNLDLVDRVRVGRTVSWVAADRERLAEWWLSNYPGPGGLSTYWYGLGGVVEQARTAVATFRSAGVRAVVSGDVAADQIAPWRRPHRAVIYIDTTTGTPIPDLAQTGFVVSGPAEATLEVLVPADPGIWGDDRDSPVPLPLTHPLQVLWDVMRAPGSDVEQAVTALRRTLNTSPTDDPHGAGQPPTTQRSLG